MLFLTLSFLRQVLTFSKRFAAVYAATNFRCGKFFFANLGLLFWQINKYRSLAYSYGTSLFHGSLRPQITFPVNTQEEVKPNES